MSNFYMMVGLPGSGKSTWARRFKGLFNFSVLSSDEYREKYLGNVEDQSKNNYIFNLIYKDTIELLNSGKNVCFDATNISRKDRRQILLEIDKNCKNVFKFCIVLMVDDNVVRKQNQSREKVVPEYVIDRMLRKFEFPLYSEGFDRINIFATYDLNLIFDEIPSYKEMYKMMKGFNQENPHHSLTLDKHCKKCKRLIHTKNKALKIAASIHDFGKLFTKSYDEKNNSCHYYNHENIGAYKAFFYEYPKGVEAEDACKYINYHMQPYRIAKCKKDKAKREVLFFDKDFYNDILELHRADILAH